MQCYLELAGFTLLGVAQLTNAFEILFAATERPSHMCAIPRTATGLQKSAQYDAARYKIADQLIPIVIDHAARASHRRRGLIRETDEFFTLVISATRWRVPAQFTDFASLARP